MDAYKRKLLTILFFAESLVSFTQSQHPTLREPHFDKDNNLLRIPLYTDSYESKPPRVQNS